MYVTLDNFFRDRGDAIMQSLSTYYFQLDLHLFNCKKKQKNALDKKGMMLKLIEPLITVNTLG